MLSEEIKNILSRRLKLHPEDYVGTQKCWDEETAMLLRDMNQTINFIENECDDNTFCWVGEIFEDVAEQAELNQSEEFIAAIKKRAQKIIDDKDRRSVEIDISFAEDRLNEKL